MGCAIGVPNRARLPTSALNRPRSINNRVDFSLKTFLATAETPQEHVNSATLHGTNAWTKPWRTVTARCSHGGRAEVNGPLRRQQFDQVQGVAVGWLAPTWIGANQPR